jgi:chromosome segregation ATPase
MPDDQDRTAAFLSPAKIAQMRAAAGAAKPAAMLEQMATDAGQAHVLRLGELRKELQAQAAQRDYSVIVSALGQLAGALPQLDFGLLEPKGWLARATGKARTAGVEFASQFDRIVQVAKTVREQTQSLLRQHQAQSAATERTLVEFEVEWQAIEKVQEQGARWLQDMRDQLKTRLAASPDAAEQQKIKDDTQRCEELVEHLKKLRSVVAVAQAAHQHAQSVGKRRHALLQSLQQLQSVEVKAWEGRLAPVATAASDTGGTALNLEGPTEAHRDLQRRLQEISADCGQLQTEEQTLARELAALGDEVQSAG